MMAEEKEGQTPSLIQLSETFKQVNLINFLIRQALKTFERGSSLIYLSVVHTIRLYGGEFKRKQEWSIFQNCNKFASPLKTNMHSR